MDAIIAGDGFGIAATGMLVVFAGLILISLFIAVLPRAFEWAGAIRDRSAPRMRGADAGVMGDETSLGIDPDLLAAIAAVIEAERERSQDRQRITLRDDDHQRVWTAIGKMRTLSTRL